jgi:hypothetical protein
MTTSDSRSLERQLPEGLVVDRKWLMLKGFNRPRIDYYLRSGRLEAVARGAYRRPGPPLKWEHVTYSLQLLGYPLHVGGRTALELQGSAHYVPLGGVHDMHIYSTRRLPSWLQKIEASARFTPHSSRLFASLPVDAITTQPFGHWDWPLRYATPELALFELTADVRSEADFSMLDKFFESAAHLRPALVTALLRTCTQIKAKRLFLWFAARHHHPWEKKLDVTDVDLGRGKRMVIPGGALDTRYQVTVPRDMANAAGSTVF